MRDTETKDFQSRTNWVHSSWQSTLESRVPQCETFQNDYFSDIYFDTCVYDVDISILHSHYLFLCQYLKTLLTSL